MQKGFPLDATLDQLEEFFDRFGAVCTCIQDIVMCFSTKNFLIAICILKFCTIKYSLFTHHSENLGMSYI